MAKKHYPVQKRLNVAQPSTGPAANLGVVHVPRRLSQVNHRLYRDSRTYTCSVSIDSNLADATTVDVYALADTWYLKGALKLAKSAWDASNAEEIAMNNGHLARWSDFRIASGINGASDMRSVQFTRDILTPTEFTAGEFTSSAVVDQAGATRTFTLGTPAATEYSIFEEYDRQPGTNTDPSVPATGPYSGLLPNLSTAAAQHISDDGNEPPYNATGYGNAYWIKVGTLHLASGRQRLSTGFFPAPMGMIVLEGIAALTNADINVEVKGGDYKGVMSHSMLE